MKILLNINPQALVDLQVQWLPLAGIRLTEERDGSFSLHVATDEEALNEAVRAEEEAQRAQEPDAPAVEMPPGVDRDA